jgi:branched-chain amino acid transport system substrate-binding protein
MKQDGAGRRGRRGLWATGCVLAWLALSAGAAGAGEPIRIGASISTTGTYAKIGRYMEEGYRLWERQVNERGGLLGRPVRIVIYDDKSEPATAVKLYEKLVTDDKVELLLGPYSSPISQAVSVIADKHKQPMVLPVAASSGIFQRGLKYIFMILAPAEVYMEGLLDIAASRGAKTVALVNEDTAFPKSIVEGAAKMAEQRGLKVVFRDAYPKGTTDFSAVLTKIKAAAPEVFIGGSYFDDSVALTRQMRELDVAPRAIAFTAGSDLPEFYQQLGKNAEYVYSPTPWEPEMPFPGSKEFVEAYRKAWNKDPIYQSAAAYGGALIFEKAVRQVGGMDRERIREALLRIEDTNLFGTYKVDERGLQVGRKMSILQWREGKKVVVWPKAIAGADPVYPAPPWRNR